MEEVRLERDTGSEWFEPQLQMTESNNSNARVQSSAYTDLSGEEEEEGMGQEAPEHCQRDFSLP